MNIFFIDVQQTIDVELPTPDNEEWSPENVTKHTHTTSLNVGTDVLEATRMFETLIDCNPDIIAFGYIRLRMAYDGGSHVLAKRSAGGSW